MVEEKKLLVESISGHLAECAFVEKSHLFKRVAKEDLVQLYGVGMLKHFEPGEFIVKEGEDGGELFLIEHGTVQVMTQGLKGLVKLAELTRGAFFGEIALLTGNPRTANVKAMDRVTTISFAKQDLESILLRYPKVRKLMQTMMKARAEAAIDKVQSQP